MAPVQQRYCWPGPSSLWALLEYFLDIPLPTFIRAEPFASITDRPINFRVDLFVADHAYSPLTLHTFTSILLARTRKFSILLDLRY